MAEVPKQAFIAVNPFEVPPGVDIEELRSDMHSKRAALQTVTPPLEKARREVVEAMKKRTLYEKKVVEIPEGERKGDEYFSTRRALANAVREEMGAISEENRAYNAYLQAYFDFQDARTRLTEYKPREHIFLPEDPYRREYKTEVKKIYDERNAYENALKALKEAEKLKMSAEIKVIKLQQAEILYEKILERIKRIPQGEVSNENVAKVLKDLKKMRETIDEHADDYEGIKKKALEAFKLMKKFQERLNPEDKLLFQNELEQIAFTKSKIPVKTTKISQTLQLPDAEMMPPPKARYGARKKVVPSKTKVAARKSIQPEVKTSKSSPSKPRTKIPSIQARTQLVPPDTGVQVTGPSNTITKIPARTQLMPPSQGERTEIKTPRTPRSSLGPTSKIPSTPTGTIRKSTPAQKTMISPRISTPNEAETKHEINDNLEKVAEATKITIDTKLHRKEVKEQLNKSIEDESPESVIQTNQLNLELANDLVEIAEENQQALVDNTNRKLEEILQNPAKHSNNLLSLSERAKEVVTRLDLNKSFVAPRKRTKTTSGLPVHSPSVVLPSRTSMPAYRPTVTQQPSTSRQASAMDEKIKRQNQERQKHLLLPPPSPASQRRSTPKKTPKRDHVQKVEDVMAKVDKILQPTTGGDELVNKIDNIIMKIDTTRQPTAEGDQLVSNIENIIQRIDKSLQPTPKRNVTRRSSISQPVTMSPEPQQLIDITRRCQKLIEAFYSQIKARHMKTVKCGEILRKPLEERKDEIVNQLKVVLTNYAREIGVSKVN